MVEWVVILMGQFFPPAHKDHIGPLAVEAAYVSVQPAAPVKKKKVNTADCNTCKGTGRVRTGDDQGWTKCPDCEPGASAEMLLPDKKEAPVVPKAAVTPVDTPPVADLPPQTEPVLPVSKYPPVDRPVQKPVVESNKPVPVPSHNIPTKRVYVR